MKVALVHDYLKEYGSHFAEASNSVETSQDKSRDKGAAL